MSKFLDYTGLNYYNSNYIKPTFSGVINEMNKNIMKPSDNLYGTGYTNNTALTVTRNSDYSITVSGTVYYSGLIILSAYFSNYKGMIISGKAVGSSTNDIMLKAYTVIGSTGIGEDTDGNGGIITSNDQAYIALYVYADRTFNTPLTFYPMICTPENWKISKTYQSYYEHRIDKNDINTIWA